MTALESRSATELLSRWQAGDSTALADLLPIIYDELRRIARRHLQGERAGHTLQTTALVHEAYLRLAHQGPRGAEQRSTFIGFASHLMRQVLVDHARSRTAAKRGGGYRIVLGGGGLGADPLQAPGADPLQAPGADEFDLLVVDEMLNRLAELDAQQARIVELRYFGGLTIDEVARLLKTSPATVKREWATARAWLLREMSRAER